MAAHEEEERNRLKAVLLEVFGASDDEDDSAERHPRIKGLHLCRIYVDHTLQVNELTCYASKFLG